MIHSRSRALPLLGAAALVLVLGACPPLDDDDSAEERAPTPAEPTPDETGDPTWSAVHTILFYRCACHRTAEDGDGGIIGMENPDLAYAALVGVASEDVPSMSRVTPGDSEGSYLVAKLEDRHRSLGGSGNRMPPTGLALPPAQIEQIRAWIDAGALDD